MASGPEGKIVILPTKHHRETPKHIKDVLLQIQANVLKSEIRICAPPGALDKIIEARIHGKVFLLRRLIQCGKHCKGCPHGPYWYGYYRSKGSFTSFYIGKLLPPRFLETKRIKVIQEIYANNPKKEGAE